MGQSGHNPADAEFTEADSSRSTVADQEFDAGANSLDPSVEEKASEYVRNAMSLGERGALMASLAEFCQTIRHIGLARDASSGGSVHSELLAAGLLALRETEDFIPRRQQLETDLDVGHIVNGHRTRVLNGQPLERMTPVIAHQTYLTYAQEKLSAAVGQSPADSMAQFGMGKVHMLLGAQKVEAHRHYIPAAIALFQSAVVTDKNNNLAANELGVLLARSGQWTAASKALAHSASINPQPETWLNLSRAHERLGERELAARARREFELAMSRRPRPQNPRDKGNVQWLEPKEFARTSDPSSIYR